MSTREEDFVERIFVASTHNYILIFTQQGRLYWLKVYQIPQAGRATRGKAIVNLINLAPGEKIAAILPVRDFAEGRSVIMVTRRGIAKKTSLSAYANPRAGGIIAISVDEGDELIDAQLTLGGQEVLLATRSGKTIRFHEEEVRETGRVARGVRGITIAREDEVVGMEIPVEGNALLTVSERGYGKRTPVAEYRIQGRGGKGTINLRTVPKVGNVSGILQVSGEEDIVLISDGGNIIRLRVEEISMTHRGTQGVKLIDLQPDEKLVGVARAEREIGDREDNGSAEDDSEEDVTPGD
jgi:DNA gyrase subunit A